MMTIRIPYVNPPSGLIPKQRTLTIQQSIRYLEHYHALSSFAARNARLTDISLDALTLSAGSSTYTIPFSPPMSSLRDARERLVSMDKSATVALNRSDITIKTFATPKGWQVFTWLVCFCTFIFLSTERNMLPGGWVYEYTGLKFFPRFVAFARKVRVPVLLGMIAIHTYEARKMAVGRLRRHSVPVGSVVWGLWVASNFVEGFPAFWR